MRVMRESIRPGSCRKVPLSISTRRMIAIVSSDEPDSTGSRIRILTSRHGGGSASPRENRFLRSQAEVLAGLLVLPREKETRPNVWQRASEMVSAEAQVESLRTFFAGARLELHLDALAQVFEVNFGRETRAMEENFVA